eukprot:6577424-Pyramimonas_sp.AAC.1
MSLPVGGTMRFLNSVNSWNAIQSRERGAKATHRVGYGRRDSSVSGSQIVSRIENQATTLSGRQVHSAKSHSRQEKARYVSVKDVSGGDLRFYELVHELGVDPYIPWTSLTSLSQTNYNRLHKWNYDTLSAIREYKHRKSKQKGSETSPTAKECRGEGRRTAAA